MTSGELTALLRGLVPQVRELIEREFGLRDAQISALGKRVAWLETRVTRKSSQDGVLRGQHERDLDITITDPDWLTRG
jgi:hypothetical protein